MPCFSEGKSSRDHNPSTHRFRVIEQHSIPIFTEDWGADEELLLLEGAETYGLGSWADIADHIGGCRNKDEVRDHYIQTYIESDNFPLPVHASPDDRSLIDEIPREEFQARKKRRIEDRKEAAKNAPPATPKQKPTASVPACHEVQGYMPGRLEFETEYFNEAEEAVQHMQFEPGDGIDPRTGQLDPEMELKMTIMNIYNEKLNARVDRKKIIFEHHLLDYRKNQNAEKKRSKEERDLISRAKPFARMMTHEDFQEFCKGIEYEHNLRQAIAQLQEWRSVQITDLKAGEKYETEKQQRVTRAPLGLYDRLQTSRISKPTPPVEAPSTASALVSNDLVLRPHSQTGLFTPPASEADVPMVNGATNGTLTPQEKKPKYVVPPLANTTPLKFDKETVADLHLLTPEEKELCSILRIYPKPYIAIKETILKEAMKSGGLLKKKAVREMCRIDVNKGTRLFEFFVHNGWIQKA